ncbi:MAG: UvrD-helicase domain-containing protein [Planctomycetota bacterium]
MDLHEHIIEGLNSPQREAVETLRGPLLILAGAGSGKTRVVTRRIANLIAHGTRPWEILAITFTNKAAAEMRRRVDELLTDKNGVPIHTGIWLSTFHSFCARLLRREAEALNYSRDFTIYDEDDTIALLKDIIKQLGLAEDKRYSAKSARQQISNLKNKALTSADLNETHFDERILKQIYQAYEEALKKNQAFDFDDLLYQAMMLFCRRPDILDRYQNRFQHVLVDEYQDTNSCQYQLIKLMSQKHRNICATGDPDQSIYAWRGADVRNILAFEKDFPEAKVVKLEQNYRSTQHILSAASAVINHNIERKQKTLWTEKPAGECLGFLNAHDEQYEALAVAQQIEKHAQAGCRYNDIAIFYRTNAQSRPLEEALRNNIPYQIVGGITFYERREVKDALGYLRLLVNPRDDVSFRRVINTPKRGVGDTALEVIQQRAAQTSQSLLETIAGPEGAKFLSTFKPKPRQGLVQFLRVIENLRALSPYPVAPIVNAMLKESGLLNALRDADELERLENLDSLVNAAAEFDEDNDPQRRREPEGPPPEPGAFDGLEELSQQQASLAGFLEKTALLTPTDDYATDDDRVTLMTLHMAKGLEFPIVFITGLEEGLLPLMRAGMGEDQNSERRALEEERRLVYVGMTRAKEKLYVCQAKFRRRFGKSDYTIPSRFLSEIPTALLETDQSLSAFERDEHALSKYNKPALKSAEDTAFANFEREVASVFGDEQQARPRSHDLALRTVVDRLLDDNDNLSDEPPPLEVGDRVQHAQFGIGTVEAISGSGLAMKAKVYFRNHGPKQLLISLARLQKL